MALPGPVVTSLEGIADTLGFSSLPPGSNLDRLQFLITALWKHNAETNVQYGRLVNNFCTHHNYDTIYQNTPVLQRPDKSMFCLKKLLEQTKEISKRVESSTAAVSASQAASAAVESQIVLPTMG